MRTPIRLLISLLLVAVPTVAFADGEADAQYKQGLAFKQQGKNDEAIAAFEKAVAANPKLGQAWASLGHLYKQKKDTPPSKIVNAYEQATQTIKKDKVLWGNLGMAYYRNEQIKGAIIDLEAAIKLKPDDPNYHNNLGVAYRTAKRNPDAIKVFKKAVELSPNDPSFHFNLAVAYRASRAENPDIITEAIAEYEKATELDPTNADGFFDLGYMYKEDHQTDKAIVAFCKYIQLSKNDTAKATAEAEVKGDLKGSCDGKKPPATKGGKKETPKKPPAKK